MIKRPHFLDRTFAAATPTSVPDKLEAPVAGQLPLVFEKEVKRVGWFQRRFDQANTCLDEVIQNFRLGC